MIAETRTIKALLFPLTLTRTLTPIGATSMTNFTVAQARAFSPTTNGVIVVLTAKAGVTREQIMAVMPVEIRRPCSSISMGRFVNGIRVATVAESFSCWIPGMSPRRRPSWRAFRWPRKILSTTSISQSVHSCRSACSWPIPSASNKDGRQTRALSSANLIDAHMRSCAFALARKQRCANAKPGTVGDLRNARFAPPVPFLSTVGSMTAVFEATPTHT